MSMRCTSLMGGGRDIVVLGMERWKAGVSVCVVDL